MAVLFRNAVESLSACRLRITAVLRLDVSRGSSTATYSVTNTHDLNCRQPNTPPFPQSRNCTRRLCCRSGLYSAYCRSCLTFSVLRRIRRCMHTSVGKLNAQTLMDVSSSVLNHEFGYWFLLQPADMVNTNGRTRSHQMKCKDKLIFSFLPLRCWIKQILRNTLDT